MSTYKAGPVFPSAAAAAEAAAAADAKAAKKAAAAEAKAATAEQKRCLRQSSRQCIKKLWKFWNNLEHTTDQTYNSVSNILNVWN